MKRRVVVTGLGLVTSLGCQTEDVWRRIVAGESGVGMIRRFDTSEFGVHIGGEISDWSPREYLSTKDEKRVDRFAQFGLVAAIDAVTDSGLEFSVEDPYRCGVIMGSGIGGLHEIEQQHRRLMERGPSKVSPFTIPKLMVNAGSGQISIRFGLRGINTAVATACASATNAIGDALRAIQDDAADVIVTGGAEAAITPMGVSAFHSLKALAVGNGDPAAASRPFDADRSGFVLSEGAGVVILEELEHAKHRSARIYAELLGYGATADGGHITQPDEHGAGAARAMVCALADAGVSAGQVAYVNAHGTSTPLGDRAETIAMKRVFGDDARRLSISSTKSQLGHLLGASGGVEFIFTVLAIRDNLVPPTINQQTADPDCDLDYTPNEARERDIQVAMSNSFGFGGHNASVVVGAAP